MKNKLYIGNLGYDITEDMLKEHFSQAGTVTSSTVITDRESGRSKGFGFVEFSNEEEAAKAIEMFNEQDFEVRNIVVNEARPKQPRTFNPGDSRDGGR